MILIEKSVLNSKCMIKYINLSILFSFYLLNLLVKNNNVCITNFKNNAYLFVEARKMQLYAAIKIFEVDIELYFVDGLINNEERKHISSKKFFQSPCNSSKTKISLFYNQTHFDNFYTPETYNFYKEILRSPVTHLNNIVFFEDKFKCEICLKEKDNKKVYFKKQNITGCFECIKNKTELIMQNRANGFIEDEYMSRECIFLISFYQIIKNKS